jgi:hypothetical protein
MFQITLDIDQRAICKSELRISVQDFIDTSSGYVKIASIFIMKASRVRLKEIHLSIYRRGYHSLNPSDRSRYFL